MLTSLQCFTSTKHIIGAQNNGTTTLLNLRLMLIHILSNHARCNKRLPKQALISYHFNLYQLSK